MSQAPACPVCAKVLADYRAVPERHVMRLTEDQQLAMLRDWHKAGHPDMNAQAKRI